MSKISDDAAFSFEIEESFNRSNTEVIVSDNKVEMYLYDSLIARKMSGITQITNAGFKTDTTKSRLNSISGVYIKQIKNQWYIEQENGMIPWDGDWISV